MNFKVLLQPAALSQSIVQYNAYNCIYASTVCWPDAVAIVVANRASDHQRTVSEKLYSKSLHY